MSPRVMRGESFLKDKNFRPFAMGSASIAYGTPLHWSAQAGVH